MMQIFVIFVEGDCISGYGHIFVKLSGNSLSLKPLKTNSEDYCVDNAISIDIGSCFTIIGGWFESISI